MDFSNVCRTCLSTKSLNPIFKNLNDVTRYTTAVYISAGVKVEQNDGLPQNMCSTCITFLNNSLKFRKQCKNAENKLLDVKYKSIENCDLVDRCNSKKPETQSTDDLEINTNYTDNESDTIEEKHDVVKLESSINIKENTEGNFNEKIPTVKTKQNTERIKCQLCYQSLSIRSIANHMARKHPGVDGHFLTCGYCKMNYGTKELLIEHVKTCTAKKKRRTAHETCKEMTECDICKKTMQKASLKMHKAIKHAGLGPVCEHCGRRFGNKFRLNEHYRAKHGYEKFKCSYCDFQSAAVIAMRNHERRHRDEKPFICETCGAKFHAAYLLAQHKHSHRAEKVHKCDQCPASFKANNSLHMHKATCHSASLYKCAMCARAYACRHYVVKHMRHVHKYSGTVPELQVLPNSKERTTNEGQKLEVEPINAQISNEKNEPLLGIW